MIVVTTFMVIAATLSFDPKSQGWQVMTIEVGPWVFLIGAILYSAAQRGLRPAYDKANLAINRLMSMQTLSHVLLVMTGLIMIENYNRFLFPLVANDLESYQLYIQFINNNWVVLLLISSILQGYTAIRLGTELKKSSGSN